jgi:hypothetical protein
MYLKPQVKKVKKLKSKNLKKYQMQKKVLKILEETISSQKLKFQTLETKKMVKIKKRNLRRSLHQMKAMVMKMTNKQKNLLLKMMINK